MEPIIIPVTLELNIRVNGNQVGAVLNAPTSQPQTLLERARSVGRPKKYNKKPSNWTEEEKATALQMKDQGAHTREIAIAVNRPVASTANMVSILSRDRRAEVQADPPTNETI